MILNHNAAVQADLDWLTWAIGLTVASLLRVDLDASKLAWWGQLAVVPLAGLCLLLAAGVVGLYDGRHRNGSFEEATAVAKTVLLATPLLVVFDAVATNPRMVPLSAVPGGAAVALAGMWATRWVARLHHERRNRPDGDVAERLLVVGAGEGAQQVVASMLHDRDGRYVPVAVLDDDPDKRNLRIKGVRVVGTTNDVVAAAHACDVSTVLIAIPSAGRDVIGRIARQANTAGLQVKVLPSVRELLSDFVGIDDIRDIVPADLLGRHEIETDVIAIAHYITGRRVLVTGAGGSIGSELCRQLHRFAPAHLYMLDRDESALHAVKLSIDGEADLGAPDLVLADLRDENEIERVLARCQPEVVFHAAALKHVPMLETHPHEAVKTNVLATARLLAAARRHGVERFVNISTDKAANPENVLGFTKRLSERLTADAADGAPGPYLSVRFGNVLGSRGSMLETFTAQIAAGGPLTVTGEDVTRYFMTVSEAVQLVIQAGAIGEPGQVLILDMGSPVRILDVARLLIDQSGRDIAIRFTGLRPGEKVHEILFGDSEVDTRPNHALVAQVAVPPLPAGLLGRLDPSLPHAELRDRLRELCCMTPLAATPAE